jgi:hypothetical protein
MNIDRLFRLVEVVFPVDQNPAEELVVQVTQG